MSEQQERATDLTQQTETPVADEATPKQTEPATKMYSQSEVDHLIGLQKAKLPDEGEWSAFKAWQAEQNKTDDPMESRLKQLEDRLSESEEENRTLKNKEQVLKSGILPEYADYALYTVSKQTSDSKDFDTALSEWLEQNGRYKQPAQPEPKAQGMRQGNRTESLDGVEENFYKLNPRLKKKE